MHKENPIVALDAIEASVVLMKARGMVQSGEALNNGIGAMNAARIADSYDNMVRAGLHAGEVELAKVADTRFVNRRVGLKDKRRLGGR